jgi:uncharacterized delta-60 repeat protein
MMLVEDELIVFNYIKYKLKTIVIVYRRKGMNRKMFRLLFVSLVVFMLLVTNSILYSQTGNPEDNTRSILNRHQINKTVYDSVQVDWVQQYISGFTPAFDYANAISVDDSGNIYITGGSYDSNQLPDIVLIKYNSAGDTVWVRRYNGSDNNWDDGQALTVDAAGNVYVTGRTYSDSTYFNYITIKYNSAGEQQWLGQYDGPSNNDDGAVALVVDGSGNVYVTGHSWQSGTSWDYVTIKYDNSGQQSWVARYNGPGNIADFATGLAIDTSNNVYVTGTSDDLSVTLYPAYTTVKYNSAGDEQWVARYNELWSYATAITVDASGNAYVTGRSYAFGTYFDYATIKYNTTGTQQWVARYHGGLSDDLAYAIAVDGAGNVYVTGEGGPETIDYATVKYNSSGVEQWARTYNGPGNAVDRGNDIALDADGSVYVTGESRGSSGADDYATVKYNPDGVEQWVVRYDSGPEDTFDLAATLAVDASNNVYVTGKSSEVGRSLITTVKYIQVLVTDQENHEGSTKEFILDQNYPNPFNPSTTIKYTISTSEFVTLKVFDVLGNEMTTLVHEYKYAGSHEIEFDASRLGSGIYFYNLQAGSHTETKKMILMK